MPMFTNYQKMKRAVDITTGINVSQGMLSNSVYYDYDASGNPTAIKLNIGTQQVQSAAIYRDEYNRTNKIVYDGNINGTFTRVLDSDNYNPVQEIMIAKSTYRSYEVTCNIDDLVDLTTIPSFNTV